MYKIKGLYFDKPTFEFIFLNKTGETPICQKTFELINLELDV